MARALLIAVAVALAPAAALAQGVEGHDVPPQMIGIQARLGAAALVGEGAGDVDQPPLQHGSLAVQVRLLEDWYLDLSTFGERTLNAEAPEGKTVLGIEGATAGLRVRPALGNPRNRLVAGAGGGGGRVFVQGSGVSFGGGMAYAVAGVEKEVAGGDAFNAGYVGIEGVYQQYFVGEDAPFRGGGITVRVTFSYYMGGSYLSDCF